MWMGYAFLDRKIEIQPIRPLHIRISIWNSWKLGKLEMNLNFLEK